MKLSSLDSWNILDSTTSDVGCGVPTPGKLSQLKVCHNKSPVLAIVVFFLLLFMMYLMFGLKLDFNGSHGNYFSKKNVVDVFNDDIVL